MKNSVLQGCFAALASVIFTLATASSGLAQNLARYASEFKNFDGTQQHAGPGDVALANGLGGVQIWDDHVTIPASVNVAYVTISATGDTSGTTVESQFSCLVDNAPCNGGTTFDATASGWIVLEEGLTSQDDNAITYTWCTPIKPLTSGKQKTLHDFSIRLATNGAGTANIEGLHVFVDGNHVKNATQACAAH